MSKSPSTPHVPFQQNFPTLQVFLHSPQKCLTSTSYNHHSKATQLYQFVSLSISTSLRHTKEQLTFTSLLRPPRPNPAIPTRNIIPLGISLTTSGQNGKSQLRDGETLTLKLRPLAVHRTPNLDAPVTSFNLDTLNGVLSQPCGSFISASLLR